MTKITDADIRKLAVLCRLKLTDAEISKYKAEISKLVEFVEVLQSVDTAGLEPTSQVTGLTNVTREDQLINYGLSRDDLLDNAPATEKGQIKVKRMHD